jgi:hypothetical protein
VRSLWAKGFTVKFCLWWEAFITQNMSQLGTTGGKQCSDDGKVETEVQKWLKQHSKDHYLAGFDILVK